MTCIIITTTKSKTMSIVLKLVEHYVNDTDIILYGPLDTSTFVFYDHGRHEYRIVGVRYHREHSKFIHYSFYCNSGGLVDFLEYHFASYNKLSICLLSYNDLPLDSDKIDFDVLIQSPQCEIVGYNKFDSEKNDFVQLVGIITNMYNY